MQQRIALLLLLSLIGLHSEAQEEKKKKVYHDLGLEIEAEYRYFYNSAQFMGQEDHYPSIALRPEYSAEWAEGYQSLNFTGFFRWDRDPERTHWDIRELYYQLAVKSWEMSVGIKKVYWGVAESNHLVDIVNQTDAIETFDGEKKLGQPMLQFTWSTNAAGTFDFYYLPYHRRRTLPGSEGRLRFGTVILTDDVGYESGAEEWHQDFAFRWSIFAGPVDLGLSYFYGTGREPLFVIRPEEELMAFYPIIHQPGLDLQITHSAFLWKLESIYRHADLQDFWAVVAGLEYTFANVNRKGLDIGVLAEYLYDERDELAITALQNDIFAGVRFGFNDMQDSSILAGFIADLDKSSKIFSVEASRRFGSSWFAVLEGRFFVAVPEDELLLSNFRRDSFVRVALSYFL